MRLLIEDGYTVRVGFRETAKRAAIEFTMRPYAGREGAEAWGAVLANASDATATLIGQMIGDAEKKVPPRIEDWSFPFDMNAENLRKLRAPEFEALVYAMHDQLAPDYEVTEKDGKRVEIPWKPSEEREGN